MPFLKWEDPKSWIPCLYSHQKLSFQSGDVVWWQSPGGTGCLPVTVAFSARYTGKNQHLVETQCRATLKIIALVTNTGKSRRKNREEHFMALTAVIPLSCVFLQWACTHGDCLIAATLQRSAWLREYLNNFRILLPLFVEKKKKQLKRPFGAN